MVVESLRQRERGRELELQMDDAIYLSRDRDRELTITHIDERLVCAMVDQHFDALVMATRRCMMKRCVVIVVKSIDIGMSIKKELHALMMAIR